MAAALGMALSFGFAGMAGADTLKLGIGAGVAPDHEGSDEYRVVPFPSFSWETDLFTLRTRGPGLEADFVPSKAFGLGPILRDDFGRDDVDDAVVSLLPDVEGSLEAGGFAEIAFPVGQFVNGPVLATARVEATQGLGDDGHGGLEAKGSVGLLVPGEPLTVGANLSVTWADEDYMRSFFGVTAAGAAASGLPVYTPDAGIKDVGASLFASYDLTEAWAVTAVASYTRLLGDAADSPIVTQRGSENQFFGGLGFTYTFQ